jgi:hypothetical protein
VASKKVNTFVEEEKKIDKIERDLFGEMDKRLKSVGSSAKGSWVHSGKSSEPVKKKKTKRVK